jgi:mono/diheme cytochrome c family protein
MKSWRNGALGVAILAAIVSACAEETMPADLVAVQRAQAAAPAYPQECQQARGGETLPQRLVAMSAQLAGTSETVTAEQLFETFASGGLCGGCHGPTAEQGGFQIQKVSDFQSQTWGGPTGLLQHVLSDETFQGGATDPNDRMPPIGNSTSEPFSQRTDSDPIKQWALLMEQWIAAGQPEQFTPGGGASAASASSTASASNGPFLLSPTVGTTMTNIGNCIPTPSLVATESDQSLALDAMFASSMALLPSAGGPALTGQQMIGLPPVLSQTDLVSLDAQVLASYGVIAYAPGYPLWSDNAGKLRFIRVPRGTSVHFNKDTQEFEIPPNTRFYKTFMKQIVDTDGSIRWRKIETRLIVSRPDLVDNLGNHTQTGLYGTYKWRDDESEADLLTTQLNDLLPFADDLFEYNTDEPLAANILSRGGDEDEVLAAGAARNYAIPGSARCMQCHMGSPSAAFVLGFTPLQIARRPVGEGGVIEPTGADELSQLERLIDYGVITGVDLPTDILPLETSQGTRTPRNNEELLAQGYMLGNCAHCHNPIGYPTVQNPVLKDVLNFLPSQVGGIFQFPLERYSPRIGRGLTGTTPIPYITPSLVDLPRFSTSNPTQHAPDPFLTGSGDTAGSPLATSAYAPWRSIIYRNVDSAFSYTDDLALFPHMPFNTPGYDPRLKQIIADWMVSIPAVRKRPDLQEYAFYYGGSTSASFDPASGLPDDSPQPYVEVTPTDPRYQAALLAAQQRLAILHTGINPVYPPLPNSVVYSRYEDPDDTTDTVDPAITNDPVCNPIPVKEPTSAFPGGTQYPFARHPSWVVTDLTSPPGWAPRRPDWQSILVDGQPPAQAISCAGGNPTNSDAQAHADEVTAIGLLQNIDLDSIRSFATTPVPFGLWQAQAACNFNASSVQATAAWPNAAPQVNKFGNAPEPVGSRPPWMDVVAAPDDAPVYMSTPGEAVFKMICINCHGPLANANGRLASNLATMTGGLARVADFRDGLFGPVGMAGQNIQGEFGPITLPGADPYLSAFVDAGGAAALPPDAGDTGEGGTVNTPQWSGIAADDVAARYMSWMALGGTSIRIPPDILQLVAATKILDQQRFLSSVSANMLSSAKALCESLLGPPFIDGSDFPPYAAPIVGGYLGDSINAATGEHSPELDQSLLNANGDAELWLKLCTMNNPLPMHIVGFDGNGVATALGVFNQGNGNVLDFSRQPLASLAATAQIPADTMKQMGNDRGFCDPTKDPSVQPACADAPNLWPWCVDTVHDLASYNPAVATAAYRQQYAAAHNLPVCPPELFGSSNWAMAVADANTFAVRGAINAGLSVFLYVQWLENQSASPPDFNQCQLLPQQ